MLTTKTRLEEPAIPLSASSPPCRETHTQLRERYRAVRQCSDEICQPLSPEDCVIQSMPDASPTRWHLAHTTWFFETFVLKPSIANSQPFDPSYEYLFNSYYNQVGEQYPRAKRGLLSRPGMADVARYRQAVDAQMEALLSDLDPAIHADLMAVVELGLNHEQQHQELMLTDVKHLFSCNPCWPVYQLQSMASCDTRIALEWIDGSSGIHPIGHQGDHFAYDNELPHHDTLLQPYQIASRLVTNAEYLEFVAEGGYGRPELWLSLGWQTVQDEAWQAPFYWHEIDGQWQQFTLSGLRPLEPNEPVCHVSYFEAEAFARWSGCRLPTEAEWEVAARSAGNNLAGNFIESRAYHPTPAQPNGDQQLHQLFGDVWEWTASPYTPYPGYQPPPGAIGEYNGKFMCNQYVLRGGSCATSGTHIRPTYRNFFPPTARWQFTGIRLAR